MAEQRKDKKPDLRRLLEDIAEDEDFTDEARERARNEIMEMEYKAWSSRLPKSNP